MAPKYDGQETHNGYLDTEPAPMFGSFKEMQEFMRAEFVRPSKPVEIKHVVLDADDTMWTIEPWGIASLASPIGHTKEDTLPLALDITRIKEVPGYWAEHEPSGSVKLAPDLRETLRKLKDKGIPVSIASCNDKSIIERYLDAFGLRDQFTDVEAHLYKSKDQMVDDIAKRNKIDSSKVLFVDDDPFNAMDVSSYTGATSLVLGYNIENIEDILEFIK